MNLDELKLGDIKKLMCLFNPDQSDRPSILNNAIGKYVIVRSRNEGINAGILELADETGCVLKEARRIWYHKPKDKNTAWYEGVSQSGLSDDSKISCSVERKYIIEDYSLTICNDTATKSISSYASSKTNS